MESSVFSLILSTQDCTVREIKNCDIVTAESLQIKHEAFLQMTEEMKCFL